MHVDKKIVAVEKDFFILNRLSHKPTFIGKTIYAHVIDSKHYIIPVLRYNYLLYLYLHQVKMLSYFTVFIGASAC